MAGYYISMRCETNKGESKMKLFYNNNDAYGDSGPYEAESKEALADEVRETFEEFAKQLWFSDDTETDLEKSEFMEIEIARMREEFISGLDEVSQ